VEKPCISLSGKMREDLLYKLFSTFTGLWCVSRLYNNDLISKKEYVEQMDKLLKIFEELLDELKFSVVCKYIEILERNKNGG